MDTLQELKEYLNVLDYPCVNVLSTEQLSGIFSSQNRVAFLTWFIEKMDPDIKLEDSSHGVLDVTIADVIHENGFCTSSQKYKFVQGDNSLDAFQQLQIIRRMLSFLADIQTDKENIESPSEPVMQVEDLAAYINRDINLFPSLGPKEIRTSNDRQEKIVAIENEILKAREEIEALLKEENLNVEYDTSTKTVDVDKLCTLKNDVTNFEETSSHLLTHKDRNKNEILAFSDTSNEIFKDCREKVHDVAEVLDNMTTISSFCRSNDDTKKSDEDDEIVDTIKKFSLLSDELVKGLAEQ